MKRTLLAFAALTAVLGASPILAQAPAPLVGPNFQVNVGAEGPQFDVDVAQDSAGDTVFVWVDLGTTPQTVLARVYDPAGNPRGLSFIVGTESQPMISHPRVAMTPLGEFTVVWGNPHTIFVRRFDRLGQPLGSASTTRSGPDLVLSPDVAVDAAGNAVVVWRVARFAGDLILLQRFNAANQSPGFQGFPETINQNSINSRENPRVALDAAGDVLVSWDDYRTGNLPDVWARRFDGPSGTWAQELRINPSTPGYQQGSTPILYPERDGAVVYSDLTAGKILVRRLDAAGALQGDPIPIASPGSVDPIAPDAAVVPDGTAAVVWQGEDLLVHAGLFDRSWNALGGDFLPSSETLDSELDPVVAAGGSGGFAIAWNSGGPLITSPIPELPPGSQDGRDGSSFGVFAQRLRSSSLCAAGSEVLCLNGGRFQARVSWKNPYTGVTGTGKALPLTGDTGSFWFFDPANLELMVKVLDGRPVNGSFWIFYGSLSNVEYTLTVTDTTTGAMKSYRNPPFEFGSRADLNAFFFPPNVATTPFQPAGSTLKTAPLPAPKVGAAGDCVPSLTALCPQNRFLVTVDFVDPRTATHGPGRASSLTNDTGVFWFFDPANLELMVKVLDGRAVNGHFWVFYGALSDVEYTITVTDVLTGAARTYHNAPHHLASEADITAFPVGQ